MAGLQGRQVSRKVQSSTYHLQLINTEAFPRQPRDVISPACPESVTGLNPSKTGKEHLTQELPRRHPSQMPDTPQAMALLLVPFI